MADELTTLCVLCRGEFTDKEVENASACPKCGSKTLPADLKRKFSFSLTEHEWRILTIFAHNHSSTCDAVDTVESILKEMRKQNPDVGPLSMKEEMETLREAYPDAKMYSSDGKEVYPPVEDSGDGS